MNKPLLTLSLFLFLFNEAVLSERLPDALAVPGGIVKIPLSKLSEPAPKAFFEQQRVLVTKDQSHWIALVGIPLSAILGEHSLQLSDQTESKKINFNIIDKAYPEQHLTIKKKRMVSGFTEQDLQKISADKVHMNRAKATWTETPVKTDFISPVDGRLSSLFGFKRFFNNIPKKPHNGLDIAAPTGSPIIAPAPAKVIDTGNYYFNGNTVFLDHGQGLLSAYLHMNKIIAQPGQRVKQGDILGTVGETGRVTGPHLHWIVYLNKTPVDPALFIADEIPRLDAGNKK